MTISFGAPMPPTATIHEVRQAVTDMASEAVAFRKTSGDTLHRRFIRAARRTGCPRSRILTAGRELTHGEASRPACS